MDWTDRFDTANMADYCQAARDLSGKGEALREAVAAFRAKADDTFGKYSKEQLVSAGPCYRLNGLKATMPKADLVRAVAEASTNASGPAKELEALRDPAWKASWCASELNDAMDNADKAATKLADHLAEPGHAAYGVEWYGDNVLITAHLARYARDVLQRVSAPNSLDFAEAVRTVAQEALRAVLGLPSHVLSNGAGGGHHTDDIAKAEAAARFLKCAAYVLGDTVPATWLTQQ